MLYLQEPRTIAFRGIYTVTPMPAVAPAWSPQKPEAGLGPASRWDLQVLSPQGPGGRPSAQGVGPLAERAASRHGHTALRQGLCLPLTLPVGSPPSCFPGCPAPRLPSFSRPTPPDLARGAGALPNPHLLLHKCVRKKSIHQAGGPQDAPQANSKSEDQA